MDLEKLLCRHLRRMVLHIIYAGMFKKTFTASVENVIWHVSAYYKKEDIEFDRLDRPSECKVFSIIDIPEATIVTHTNKPGSPMVQFPRTSSASTEASLATDSSSSYGSLGERELFPKFPDDYFKRYVFRSNES